MPIELFPPMTRDQAEAWFGTKTSRRFNPDGPVTQLWWKTCNFPELEAVDETGTADFYHFADGTVFRRAADGEPTIVTASAGGGVPDGVDEALVAKWFGKAVNDGQEYRFDPNDPVCRLWLELGRFPRLIWVNDFGGRLYFRFADGTVIYRPAPNAGFRVLGAKTGDGLYPDGMDAGLAEEWFGDRFSESGPVSRLWLKVGQQRKRFPAYLGEDQQPNGQYFRFADGMVFLRANPADDPILFPDAGTTAPLGIRTIIGDLELNVSQDFGPTDFVYDYNYCWEYGVPQGVHSHCAMDIVVPYGTPLYSPANGEVICAGTGDGCAAYEDERGGVGRVEIELAGGVRVILGHASECFVAKGATVTPRQKIAASGIAGTGDHLHLEVRVPDSSTGSGYRTVDPCEFFRGCDR